MFRPWEGTIFLFTPFLWLVISNVISNTNRDWGGLERRTGISGPLLYIGSV
jgi:hypothetical protein